MKKYFTLLLVICVIRALISFDLTCYAQAKNKEKNLAHKLSFVGSWDEGKATKIITDICKRWKFNERQEDYSIKKSLSFKKDGIQKRFVQISRNGESCHYCPGLIGAVIYSKNNSHWEVEFEEENFAKFGFYGVAPQAKLIKIGSDRYGLLFQWSQNAQGGGGYVHYVALFDLRDKGYKLILGEKIYQTEVALYPDTPKVEVISTINGDFYNIRINSKIYKFREGKYKVLNK